MAAAAAQGCASSGTEMQAIFDLLSKTTQEQLNHSSMDPLVLKPNEVQSAMRILGDVSYIDRPLRLAACGFRAKY